MIDIVNIQPQDQNDANDKSRRASLTPQRHRSQPSCSRSAYQGLRLRPVGTALPITPGGLGVLEVGLTGALSAVATGALGSGGGAPTGAELVAGLLLFRFLTYALPLPLGAIGLSRWYVNRRSLRPRSLYEARMETT
ncbi:MAG: YbhN family protein [Acidimicrobiia bacterium]|nr:YbhN family protein [Acidimicrobiia bacterium]